jgi:hypothetical protein
MKSKAEIENRIYILECEIKKHEKNPEQYDENFTNELKEMKNILEWVLKKMIKQ